tara:strand:+ start:197 stop:901 length:705 start_codon:yes stop_codon:yes gene_type:complete
VTQEEIQTELVDPISQTQAELDAAQQGQEPAQPSQYVTAEQFEALQKQNVQVESQLRGLQGKIDSGLNAIRRDSEIRFEEQRRRESQARIEAAPEEFRAQAQQYEQMIGELQQQSRAAAAPAQEPDWMVEAKRVVEEAGLSADDPGINYKALEANDRPGFMRSITNTAIQNVRGSSPGQQQPASDQTVSPPARTPTPAGGGGHQDIMDAYIRGELEPDEAEQKLRAIGKSLPGR